MMEDRTSSSGPEAKPQQAEKPATEPAETSGASVAETPTPQTPGAKAEPDPYEE
jgi:hypothetical protein